MANQVHERRKVFGWTTPLVIRRHWARRRLKVFIPPTAGTTVNIVDVEIPILYIMFCNLLVFFPDQGSSKSSMR